MRLAQHTRAPGRMRFGYPCTAAAAPTPQDRSARRLDALGALSLRFQRYKCTLAVQQAVQVLA